MPEIMNRFQRDLDEAERIDYKILAEQLLSNRPAFVHCEIGRKFVRLWYAYEIKCRQLKRAEERS